MRNLPATTTAAAALMLAAAPLLAAPPAPRHGGHVAMAGGHAFEVVFDDHGLHVLPRTPLPAALDLAASVTLRARRQAPEQLKLKVMRTADGAVDHLMLARDFSGVPDGSRKAELRITGLGDRPAEVSLVLRRPPPGSKKPMAGSDHSMAGSHSGHAAGAVTRQEKLLDVRDEAIAKAQRASYPIDWCLVSGDKLGADGPPVDVVVKGRLIRVCCDHCVSEVRADPDRYLRDLAAAAKGKPAARPAGSHSSHEAAGSDHGHGDHGHGGHDH